MVLAWVMPLTIPIDNIRSYPTRRRAVCEPEHLPEAGRGGVDSQECGAHGGVLQVLLGNFPNARGVQAQSCWLPGCAVAGWHTAVARAATLASV